MKIPVPAKLILTGLALAVAGCNLDKKPPEAETRRDDSPRPGPAAAPGPIQPAPEPHLPATTKYDPTADEAAKSADAKPDEKKAETKPEEKKAEPKLEDPK